MKKGGLYLLGFAAIGIGLYAQTLRYDFINWDDFDYIKDNIYIRRLSFHNIFHIFSTLPIGEWFPLQLLSYAVDFSLWGLNTAGYHLENILLHSFNAFLVFVLMKKLLSEWDVKRGKTAAIMTGLLFLVHPVQVESVVWMSQRKTVLCTFFFLLSFLSYLSWREGGLTRSYSASLLFFIASLLSKVNSMGLPLVLLAWEYAFNNPRPPSAIPLSPPFSKGGMKGGLRRFMSLLVPLIPFGMISAGIMAVFLYGQFTHKIIREFYGGTPYTNLLVTLAGFVFKYPNRLPFPVNLSAYYPRVDEYRSLISMPFLIAIPVWIYCWITLLTSSRTSRTVFFLVLAFAIIMFPTAGFVPAPFGGADRHLYILSMTAFALFSMGCLRLAGKYPKTVGALFIAVLGLLSLLTLERSRVWRSSLALWEDVVRKSPQLPYAQHKVALLYLDAGRYNDALLHVLSAESLDPSIALYHYSHGLIRRSMNDNAGALHEFFLTDHMEPGNSVLHREMASTFADMKEWDKAIEEYEKSISLDPDKAFASMRDLGILYIRLGRYNDAVKVLERAVEVVPDSAEVHRSLGVLYVKELARTYKGLYHLRMSLELDPAQPDADMLKALIMRSGLRPSTP